jgi:hypothetical protein
METIKDEILGQGALEFRLFDVLFLVVEEGYRLTAQSKSKQIFLTARSIWDDISDCDTILQCTE